MNRIHIAIAAVAALAFGLAAGYWWGNRTPASTTMGQAVTATERPVLYWYDPMVPEQRFDKPGKSPFMDMQLVPKYADDIGGTGATGIRIDPDTRQNLGIRTAVVELGRVAGEVRVPATLGWDLRLERVVSARVDALVARLHVKTPYQPVVRGQPLAELLAPEWSSAIAEYRALGSTESAAADALRDAARQRLRLLGLSDTAVRGSGPHVVLHAPVDGVVSEILVREGTTVRSGEPLFRVNGTATLWLEAAIPQAGSSGVVAGTPITATVSVAPGRVFAGRVETLLPQIDAGNRTQRARIVLDNADGLLVPGMFADVVLRPDTGARVPLVPSEALITTGSDSRVIVVGDDGRFRPVPVRAGRSGGGRTEILDGLQAGARVVVSGQFLIDSEASLAGALERLTPVPPAPAASGAPGADGTKPMPATPAPQGPENDPHALHAMDHADETHDDAPSIPPTEGKQP